MEVKKPVGTGKMKFLDYSPAFKIASKQENLLTFLR